MHATDGRYSAINNSCGCIPGTPETQQEIAALLPSQLMQSWIARAVSKPHHDPGCAAGGAASDEVTCGTCFCDVESGEATEMECGHVFCNGCWRQHCKIQISDGNSRQLPCMAVGCGAICDESRVRCLAAVVLCSLLRDRRGDVKCHSCTVTRKREWPVQQHCCRLKNCASTGAATQNA